MLLCLPAHAGAWKVSCRYVLGKGLLLLVDMGCHRIRQLTMRRRNVLHTRPKEGLGRLDDGEMFLHTSEGGVWGVSSTEKCFCTRPKEGLGRLDDGEVFFA